MKSKTAVTVEAVHTHTHTHNTLLQNKERRYAYYLSISPLSLIISKVRRLFVRGGLIG